MGVASHGEFRDVRVILSADGNGPTQMPDVYANITSAQPALLDQIASVLELRAADAQQRALRESYLSEISFPKGAHILDVGCGTGAVTRVLAEWPNVGQVVGVDPSPSFLEKARQLAAGRANLVFEQADGRDHSKPIPLISRSSTRPSATCRARSARSLKRFESSAPAGGLPCSTVTTLRRP